MSGGRARPLDRIVQWALTLLVVGLLFGVVLPLVVDWDEVFDALGSLDGSEVVVLVALALTRELLKSAPNAILLPGLGMGRALVADGCSSLMSNVLPGPSGTLTRMAVLRSWGVGTPEFLQSMLVNSVWNNAVQLVMPAVALALLSLEQSVPARLLWLSVLGVVLAVALGAVLVLSLRSSEVTRRVARLVGAVVNRVLGLVGRPTGTDWVRAALHLRSVVLAGIARGWVALTLVVVGRNLVNAAIMLAALRALGVDGTVLTALEVLAVVSVVRILTMVEITPGGIGVTEVLFTLAFTTITDGAFEAEIVAAVLVHRVLTYVLPILLGAVSFVVWRRIRPPVAEGEGSEEGPEADLMGAILEPHR